MLKALFAKRPPNKFDVLMAITGAVVAVWKANDTVKEFRAAQAEDDKEIEK